MLAGSGRGSCWKEWPVSSMGNRDKRHKSDEVIVARLYQQIGRLKVERDFLAKTYGWKARLVQEVYSVLRPRRTREIPEHKSCSQKAPAVTAGAFSLAGRGPRKCRLQSEPSGGAEVDRDLT